MNREQVEAVACEVRALVRGKMKDGLMVCVLASPGMDGLVVASSLDPERLKEFFGVLAEAPSRMKRLDDLEGGE